MRWSILAGVVTLRPVMAQVGEIVDVRFAEGQPAFHCGENGAIAFAITAGIADDHEAFAFCNRVRNGRHARLPFRRSVRIPTRSSCRTQPDSLYRECCR